MKIIYITGDDDYSYVLWEELSKKKKKNIIDKLNKTPGLRLEFDEACYAEIKEFKDVDPKFIEFIKHEIMDYDISKGTNFEVLDEN